MNMIKKKGCWSNSGYDSAKRSKKKKIMFRSPKLHTVKYNSRDKNGNFPQYNLSWRIHFSWVTIRIPRMQPSKTSKTNSHRVHVEPIYRVSSIFLMIQCCWNIDTHYLKYSSDTLKFLAWPKWLRENKIEKASDFAKWD